MHEFHFSNPEDIFREFFGGQDPFSAFFGGGKYIFSLDIYM